MPAGGAAEANRRGRQLWNGDGSGRWGWRTQARGPRRRLLYMGLSPCLRHHLLRVVSGGALGERAGGSSGVACATTCGTAVPREFVSKYGAHSGVVITSRGLRRVANACP